MINMKNFVKTLIRTIILGVMVLTPIALIGWLVEWACADSGRYVLVMGIIGYIVWKAFLKEFGE